jgi:hypothetical protein
MKPEADQKIIFAVKAQIEAKQKPKMVNPTMGGGDWKLIPTKSGESKRKVVMINVK